MSEPTMDERLGCFWNGDCREIAEVRAEIAELRRDAELLEALLEKQSYIEQIIKDIDALQAENAKLMVDVNTYASLATWWKRAHDALLKGADDEENE